MKKADPIKFIEKRKRGGRENFNRTTRRDLAAGAGEKCSIYRCLKLSSCITAKKDGTIGRVNLGVASHIYAAAGRGPRPAPPGMGPELISHHSNGIWTCRDCGNAIDSMECEYSADDLKWMKLIRETAQNWAASDPQIRNLIIYILPIEYDEIFWDHFPNLDSELIRNEIIKQAGSGILANISKPRFTPTHLSLRPMVRCVRKASEKAEVSRKDDYWNRREEDAINFSETSINADELDWDADNNDDDDDDGDDPELDAIYYVNSQTERGYPYYDDTLSPKGMDKAEILAGLRDPD